MPNMTNLQVADFLNKLAGQNAIFWADGERLRYRAPENVMTPTVISTLKEHKPEILHLLQLRADPSQPFPLTHGQRALWFLYQMAPESAAYNLVCALRLQPNINVSILRNSVEELVQRHPTLRTTYGPADGVFDGEPMQQTQRQISLPWSQTVLPHRLDKPGLNQWLEQEAERPFDLGKESALRVHLLQHGIEGNEPESILILTAHHIGFDFLSLEILIDELCVFYHAERTETEPIVPPLTLHYRDHVHHEMAQLAGPRGEQSRAYWQQTLAGDLPQLDLPTDHPRPPIQRYDGHACPVEIDGPLANQLRALAKTLGVTPFVVMQAAFQLLLGRYTGQDDLLIGVPMAGRTQAELDCVVGYFANPIVLRADLSGNPSFSQLCLQVRQSVVEGLDHQAYPFSLLIDTLQVARDAGRSPLFQASFVWDRARRSQGIAGTTPAQKSLISEFLLAEQRGSAFDLSLSIVDGGHSKAGDEISGEFRGNASLFVPATLARMANQYRTLLAEIVADPAARITDFPLLPAAEKDQLLVKWNETTVDSAAENATILHQLFEDQAERTPNATAVVFEDRQLTYAELNQRANQLAQHLQGLGVGPESLVGVCLERSLEMVVGLLGVLKAGGAYVPMDPSYPTERLAFMFNDAEIKVLLTHSSLNAVSTNIVAEGQAPHIVNLDTDWRQICARSTKNPLLTIYPANPAYVIYTSGSTGQPKGVVVTHGAICNHMSWMLREFPLLATDSVLQKTPVSFDASIWEFYAPLLSGAKLVMARPGGHADVLYMIQALVANEITTLQVVPSMLRLLLDQDRLRACTSLQRVFCGGEALTAELRDALFAQLPNVTLHNLYGPTEATVEIAFWSGDQTSRGETVPIGRPIDNTQLYILDLHLNPVPTGAVGELFIGGASLSRGYRQRPDTTANCFVPNPFSNEAGARLYKTGDLVRYLTTEEYPSGSIEYLGRLDHQHKLHGFRIEVGEIEAALEKHPAIQQAVVDVRSDEKGVSRLVAYYTNSSIDTSTEALSSFLKNLLPGYMIPALFVPLDDFPQLPNGKIDRQALPISVLPLAGAAPETAAPTSRIEERLVAIWQKVLGHDELGIHDNFFSLGGDSIQAIQMVALAGEAGLHLTANDLFQYQTIAELATVANSAPEIQAEQGRATGPVTLTPIQQRFFEQELTTPHHWNQALWLDLAMPVDPGTLQMAMNYLFDHHDGLRMRFQQTKDGWKAANIEIETTVELVTKDVSALSADEARAIQHATEAELQTSLNLERGPLLRMALFDHGTEQRLLVIIHHLVVDGVSWRILVEDLERIYRQLIAEETVQLPRKTTSFQKWAKRLHNHAQTPEVAAEADFWLDASTPISSTPISSTPIAPLPVDMLVGENSESMAAYFEANLDIDSTQALFDTLAQYNEIGINDLLLTALAQTLQEWTGNPHCLIELEGHGREALFDDIDLSRTIGWFTSFYPVALEVPHAAGGGNALPAIAEQLSQIPHGGISHGLQRYLTHDPERANALASQPRPDICFNYLGQTDGILAGSELWRSVEISDGPTRSPDAPRPHLIEVNSWVAQDRLIIRWGYSQALHHRTTIETLVDAYITHLNALTVASAAQDAEVSGHRNIAIDVDLNQDDFDDLLLELNELELA